MKRRGFHDFSWQTFKHLMKRNSSKCTKPRWQYSVAMPGLQSYDEVGKKKKYHKRQNEETVTFLPRERRNVEFFCQTGVENSNALDTRNVLHAHSVRISTGVRASTKIEEMKRDTIRRTRKHSRGDKQMLVVTRLLRCDKASRAQEEGTSWNEIFVRAWL